MSKLILPAIIFCLGIHHTIQYEIANIESSEPDNDFDVFVFTQHWPVSVCKYWVNELNGTECAYPKERNRWTVHGIWPRKYGAKYNYCNSSWAFDPRQIKYIKRDLEQAWTAIYNESDPYKLWKHEWVKHGTCATGLQSFNSQFKYFNKGIEWNMKYSLSKMLGAAHLFPSDTKTFTAKQFTNAVKDTTKKNPMIGCYEKDGLLYLNELRICLDKKLNLVDCGPPIDEITCFPSKPIYYPIHA